MEGNPTFLVIHVTTGDGAPSKSITELVDDILGVDTDPVNLVSQILFLSSPRIFGIDTIRMYQEKRQDI